MERSCRSRMTPRTKRAASGTARRSTRRLARFMRSLRLSTSNLRCVGLFLADGQDLRQHRDEFLDEIGIETLARFALDKRDRVLDGPGLLVGTIGCQGVEHVGDRCDA